ncbi:hypothetical protein C8Q73DRAFT_327609 [Cubamyces lactineus]|nr:hypothetical protein C8Q73DRAFT_327609 [Cubamyces lactineus]
MGEWHTFTTFTVSPVLPCPAHAQAHMPCSSCSGTQCASCAASPSFRSVCWTPPSVLIPRMATRADWSRCSYGDCGVVLVAAVAVAVDLALASSLLHIHTVPPLVREPQAAPAGELVLRRVLDQARLRGHAHRRTGRDDVEHDRRAQGPQEAVVIVAAVLCLRLCLRLCLLCLRRLLPLLPVVRPPSPFPPPSRVREDLPPHEQRERDRSGSQPRSLAFWLCGAARLCSAASASASGETAVRSKTGTLGGWMNEQTDGRACGTDAPRHPRMMKQDSRGRARALCGMDERWGSTEQRLQAESEGAFARHRLWKEAWIVRWASSAVQYCTCTSPRYAGHGYTDTLTHELAAHGLATDASSRWD